MEMLPLLEQIGIIGFTLFAGLLGGLIGLERERSEKPAGVRTMSLISASSALIVALGVSVNEFYGGIGDPVRALHGVITGIGFLGAGTIAINNKTSRGGHLTTAATVFASAAVGITVGLGAPLAGFLVTLLILFALRFSVILEKLGVRGKEKN